MKSTITAVAGRARPRRKPTPPAGSRSPAQLGVLPPEPLDLGRLLAGDARPGARVDLGLAHPLADRLRACRPRAAARPAPSPPSPTRDPARISATIRTARSFSSGGYLLDVFPDMTPTFPRFGVSGHAGAVQQAGVAGSRVAGGHRAATRSALDAVRGRADSEASGSEKGAAQSVTFGSPSALLLRVFLPRREAWLDKTHPGIGCHCTIVRGMQRPNTLKGTRDRRSCVVGVDLAPLSSSSGTAGCDHGGEALEGCLGTAWVANVRVVDRSS